MILLLLFRASLDPHKKANSESNMGFVYPSIGPYMVPLFWILIYGLFLMLYIICFLTNTRSNMSNYLISFPFLCSSLCLSLLSDTRILNSSIFITRSGDADSNWFKAWCTSEVPSLDLTADISIVNGDFLPISNTYRAIPFPSTVPVFQLFCVKDTPCNHWWRLPFSSEFIFCTLFKYLWNP